MAAKKTQKKTAKKPAAKKTAAKKPAAKKPVAKKPAAKKKAGTPRPKPDASAEGGEAAAPSKAKGSGVRAAEVNMGHVFALRPRVATSFPQQALLDARLALVDESYATIGEAARAVAERALEITHDAGKPSRGRNTPRF